MEHLCNEQRGLLRDGNGAGIRSQVDPLLEYSITRVEALCAGDLMGEVNPIHQTVSEECERIALGTETGAERAKPFVVRPHSAAELRNNRPVTPDDGRELVPNVLHSRGMAFAGTRRRSIVLRCTIRDSLAACHGSRCCRGSVCGGGNP
jgi:hypothetical protein